MGKEQLKSKIEEQQIIYQALKAGNDDTVRYKEFHNREWGMDDENYTNRLRLAYYLLYCHIEDDFEANSLLDCLYLCQEMEYRDVMESLVDEWKEDTTEWSAPNRRVLIDFNTFLGRDAENERL